jgi:hypothetical protein
MNKQLLHKIISVCVAFPALLPMSIQFAHAVEIHSHDICEENSIQHFHKHEIECKFDHYFFKINTVSFNEIIQETIVSRLVNAPVFYTNIYYKTASLKLNSRGPPSAII